MKAYSTLQGDGPAEFAGLKQQLDELTSKDLPAAPESSGVYPTFNMKPFARYFEGLWAQFRTLGVEVRLDDLDQLAAYLLSATNPTRPTLVVDRRMHLNAGLTLRLYYHMLAHVRLGHVEHEMTCLAESRTQGMRLHGETATDAELHAIAEAQVPMDFEKCIHVDPRTGEEPQVRDLAIACDALPGNDRVLRFALSRIQGPAPKTHAAITRLRRIYHDEKYSLIQRVFGPDTWFVRLLRKLAVAVEIRQYIPAPAHSRPHYGARISRRL